MTVLRMLPMPICGILCNLFVGMFVGHLPVVYLLAIGTLCTSASCLLFAVIIPSAPYWAFGFPAAILSVIGADFVYSAGTLFTAKVALPHEQSLAGALFQTMTQIGAAIGMTVSTVVFDRVGQYGRSPAPHRELLSYQAAQWTCFSFGVIATILACAWFRGVGIVGHRKIDKPVVDPTIEEATSGIPEKGI